MAGKPAAGMSGASMAGMAGRREPRIGPPAGMAGRELDKRWDGSFFRWAIFLA
jgi:hypothetical protein